MKLKKLFLLTCLLCGFSFTITQAQNYYIDFTASGTTTTLDSVYVENLTQGTSLTIQGGDTLHLYGTVGITSHDNNSSELKIYPNPFSETSRLEFYCEAPTVATIDVYDVVGKHVVHLKQDIQKGTNLFEVSGFATGHYKLSISTDTWQKTAGFVSLNTGSQSPQIQFKSNLSKEFHITGTTKSTKNTVSMPYTTGDQMRFIGFSGILSEIVNDVPTSSKTIDFAYSSSSCGNNITFNYNGASVTYGTVLSSGNCWLDRNLGAFRVAISSSDTAAYGDLFQWGRAVDGHQIRTSDTTSVLSNSDTPGHGDFIITGWNFPYDWRSPQNANLWQGVSCTNNPCPAGWRLPTEAEWDTERQSWSSNDTAGAFSSPLKLTITGHRSFISGLLSSVSHGHYWSSGVTSGSNSRILVLYSNDTNILNSSRAFGLSVRCIKDNMRTEAE